VAKWNSVQPNHVRQAAVEYDQLGPDEFLTRHGFGHARAYLLILSAVSLAALALCPWASAAALRQALE